MHRRRTCLAVGVTVLFTGLLWRLAPFHLPAPLYKYGGSVLWAAMIYWLLAALLPAGRVLRIALLAIFVATAVECFKLYHSPVLDAFRLTLVGKLLLGRIFSRADLLAYLAAISSSASADSVLHRHKPPTAVSPDRFAH